MNLSLLTSVQEYLVSPQYSMIKPSHLKNIKMFINTWIWHTYMYFSDSGLNCCSLLIHYLLSCTSCNIIYFTHFYLWIIFAKFRFRSNSNYDIWSESVLMFWTKVYAACNSQFNNSPYKSYRKAQYEHQKC